ncbi:MAG: hypothetical protein R3F19_28925 [Verrucomicrobiales bacterium]
MNPQQKASVAGTVAKAGEPSDAESTDPSWCLGGVRGTLGGMLK